MVGDARFKQAEFVKLQFMLRFNEVITVDLATLLRLRRSLRAAANYCFMGHRQNNENRFGRLFSPDLSHDPVARRQFQKSSPAFVLQFDDEQLGIYQRGDLMPLNVIIWGGNLDSVNDFAHVVTVLGKTGLRHDAGRFEIVEISAEDSACRLQKIWSHEEPFNAFVAPVRDGDWWLNSCALECDHVQLQFLTPARLIVKQRPVFQPTFKVIFPFILRRVTSMLYSHCCCDLEVDTQALFGAAESVETQENKLKWNDWRELKGIDSHHPLGGIEGTIDLYGPSLIDLIPYLYLGSLMNLGKNAAYGAGRYRIVAPISLG